MIAKAGASAMEFCYFSDRVIIGCDWSNLITISQVNECIPINNISSLLVKYVLIVVTRYKLQGSWWLHFWAMDNEIRIELMVESRI